MKKALYILTLVFIAEAAFIFGSVTLPTLPAADASAVMVTRRRASKSDIAIMRKVLPVEYKRMTKERDFFEDIARYYSGILTDNGIF